MSLLDLDDCTPTQNGQSHVTDPFDPYGTAQMTNGGGDAILLDFSSDTSTKQTPSGNPLYDLMDDDITTNDDIITPHDIMRTREEILAHDEDFTTHIDDTTTHSDDNATNNDDITIGSHGDDPMYELSVGETELAPSTRSLYTTRTDNGESEEEEEDRNGEESDDEEVSEDQIVPTNRVQDTRKEITTSTTTQDDGTILTETTTTYTDTMTDGSVRTRTEVVQEMTSSVTKQETLTPSEDSEDEDEIISDNERRVEDYGSEPDEYNDQEPVVEEEVQYRQQDKRRQTEEGLFNVERRLTQEEIDEKRSSGRPLSKSFEEYENVYQEYKPPKKFVKPPDKEEPGATKTVIMGLPHATYVSPPQAARQVSTPSDKNVSAENEDNFPKEIVKADDKTDDSLESCRTLQLGSLKSRFEVPDASPVLPKEHKRTSRTSPSPTTSTSRHNGFHDNTEGDNEDREILKENIEEKDIVSFKEIGKVKSMFEQPSATPSPVPQSRRQTSTKRVHEPSHAPVVNRNEEEAGDYLPPVGSTRSQLDKFKSMGVKGEAQPKRTTHEFTPPREEDHVTMQYTTHTHSEPETNPDIIRSGDRVNDEEELPPSNYTKNMLAMFKQFECNDKPAPTPERKINVKVGSARKYGLPADTGSYKGARSETSSVSATSSLDNINTLAESGGEVPTKEVVRAEDHTDEGEFPEYGFTKNLLAKFKTMETNQPTTSLQPRQTSPAPRTVVDPLTRGARKSWGPPSVEAQSTAQQSTQYANSPDGGGDIESSPVVRPDVTRETDNHSEVELPEQGLARNLLAKFRSMESTSAVPLPDAQTPKSLHRPTPPRDEPVLRSQSRVSNNSDAHSDSGIGEHDGGEYESHPTHRPDVIRESDRNDESELPPLSFTKNMLAKYQNIHT